MARKTRYEIRKTRSDKIYVVLHYASGKRTRIMPGYFKDEEEANTHGEGWVATCNSMREERNESRYHGN